MVICPRARLLAPFFILKELLFLLVFTFALHAETPVRQWGQSFPASHATAMDLVKDHDGKLAILAGTSTYLGTTLVVGRYDGATGARLWSKEISSSNPGAVAVDAANNVIVSGTNGAAAYTTKLTSANGKAIWMHRGDSTEGYSEEKLCVVDAVGDVITAGDLYPAGGNSALILLTKYSGVDGSVVWAKRLFAGSVFSQPVALALDSEGGVLLTGRSGTSNFAGKYSGATGDQLWLALPPAAQNSSSYLWTVAVDAQDNAIVGGFFHAGLKDQGFVAKYAAADGTLLWQTSQPPLGHPLSEITALTLDSEGQIYATGRTGTNSNLEQLLVMKLDADGAIIWEHSHAGPNGGRGVGSTIVLDAHGDAVVSGTVKGIYDGGDVYLGKFSGETGEFLWEVALDDGLQGNNYFEGVRNLAALPDGGIVVMGNLEGSLGSSSGSIFKYQTVSQSITTLAPENVRPNSVTFRASVNPAGTLAQVQFLLDGEVVAAVPAGSGTEEVEVSKAYSFSISRREFTVSSQMVTGAGLLSGGSLTVQVQVPSLVTLPPINVNARSAILQTSVDPRGEPVEVQFLIGGRVMGSVNIPAGGGARVVSLPILTLAAVKNYSVQTRIHSAVGTIDGGTVSFWTPTRGMAAWKKSWFGLPRFLDASDPDEDGATTLFEYAVLSNPTTSDADTHPKAAPFDYPDGRRMRILVPRDPLRPEVIIYVETAAAPTGPWSVVAVSVGTRAFHGPGYVSGETRGIGNKLVEIRDPKITDDTNPRFMRVRVRRNG